MTEQNGVPIGGYKPVNTEKLLKQMQDRNRGMSLDSR